MADDKKYEGPIYDLMRAYSQLTYGNIVPRVVAGYAARKWIHNYVQKHSRLPHCEDRYMQTIIEHGDIEADTVKFFLEEDIKESLMNSYRDRMMDTFDSQTPPPNLDPIFVKVPIGENV